MTQPVSSSPVNTPRLQHDINNRIQSLLLGIGLLERSADDDVRDIARELNADLRDLYQLLQHQKSSSRSS